jgi:hypothetical protein
MGWKGGMGGQAVAADLPELQKLLHDAIASGDRQGNAVDPVAERAARRARGVRKRDGATGSEGSAAYV